MNWQQRSYEKELLDGDDNSFEEIRLNMAELNTINQWLGGHSITVKGMRRFAKGRKSLRVCEIGCGGGDNLAVISRWALKRGISLQCIGIDINPDCITFAKQQFPQATYIKSDYRDVCFDEKPTVIFSSLFCHHFTDAELLDQLQWMRENAEAGFFINDLHRHPLAYYSIKYLSAGFSHSKLVKHDAPLSVCRGFTRKDWVRLMKKAGLTDYDLSWEWAFRWLVSVSNSA